MDTTQVLVDVHTHTLISGHAFCTLNEMVAAARAKGLKIFGITEHGPGIPGTCDPLYFRNTHVVPRQWGDMRLLMGAEVNILDTRGTLDLDEFHLSLLDLRIAGIHQLCWTGGTRDENTAGMVAAIRNPWTHIISHPGDGTAELDFEPIVLAAKESHTLLEINNSTFKPSRGKAAKAKPNNMEILRLCKLHDVPVILGSDAHYDADIANYCYVLPMLAEAGFPPQLVLNDKPEEFCQYLGLDI